MTKANQVTMTTMHLKSYIVNLYVSLYQYIHYTLLLYWKQKLILDFLLWFLSRLPVRYPHMNVQMLIANSSSPCAARLTPKLDHSLETTLCTLLFNAESTGKSRAMHFNQTSICWNRQILQHGTIWKTTSDDL